MNERERVHQRQRRRLEEATRQEAAERIQVELLAAGKVRLRDPETHYVVEIVFTEASPKTAHLTDIRVHSDGHALPMELDLSPYMRAFGREIRERPSPDFRRLPRTRPQPGQSFSRSFYERIVEQYDALKKETRSPAKELAERMGVDDPATIRLWVHRGREYLDRGKDTLNDDPKGVE